MTSTTYAPSRSAVAKLRLVRFAAWHPEWWVVSIAAGAWIGLVLDAVLGRAGADDAGSMHLSMPGMTTDMSHPSTSSAMTVGGSASMWMLMLMAMMLPVLVPRVRLVAAVAVGSVRQRAVLQTIGGWVAVWSGVGAVVVAVAVRMPDIEVAARPVVFVLCWMPAAVWQFSPWKRRALIRCHGVSVPPGVHDGWRRVKAGARQTRWCVVSCGPAMVTMALTGHSLLIMATLTVGLVAERIGFRPGRAARRLGVGMVAAASLVALLTIGA